MGSDNSKLGDKYLHITGRKEWGARKPFHRDPLRFPVATVLFTATHNIRFPWWDRDRSHTILRQLQLFHMYQKMMPDVQYNFMIDEHGNIYEGRGWYTKPSKSHAEKKPANVNNSLYVGYVGIMTDDGPTDNQMKAGNDLISYGMRHELIRYHHHITGLIPGIVGTTLEECLRRRKAQGLKVHEVELEPKPAPATGSPADQYPMMY